MPTHFPIKAELDIVCGIAAAAENRKTIHIISAVIIIRLLLLLSSCWERLCVYVVYCVDETLVKVIYFDSLRRSIAIVADRLELYIYCMWINNAQDEIETEENEE